MQFILAITLPILLAIGSCDGQNNTNSMKNKSDSPLLCDPIQAICEIPDQKSGVVTSAINTMAVKKPVRVLYFTDPICSSCWGIEPQLRRLKLEYGHAIEIEYHMGGLLPKWEGFNGGGISKPSDVATHWDEVSGHYEMPIDGDVWLEDPLPSSYPPSIAFKAAQMQDEKIAIQFLRRIREMVFLEKKNITRWEHLETAARQVGLDATKLKTDYDGAAQKAFQDDLNLARSLGVRGFPTLFFSDTTGQRLLLYGSKPYALFEKNVAILAPEIEKMPYKTNPEDLFAHYPTLTAKEYSVLTGLPLFEAEVNLDKLFEGKKLDKLSTKNGALWSWKQ